MLMTTQQITEAVIKKYPDKYPQDKAAILVEKIDQMTPGIKKSLELFLETGTITPVWLLGFDIDKLMKEHGMNEVASYLTIDWLARDPDAAMASLSKGHEATA